MFIILMGPPGAGKGTQAEKLTKEFALIHVSTGDIFRNAVKEGTEMGKKAKEYMDKGELVPDEIVLGIVKERLSKPDCKAGVLLDGFPRTIEQAEALDEVLEDLKMKIDAVINIDVSEEELIARLTGRRVCRNCGATYHIKFNPPKVRNICDHCSGELYQRSDDTIDTVKERLNIYNKQTLPMVDYYERKGMYKSADGSREIDQVFADIAAYLQNKEDEI
ncbi:MAG TPA: adenylate kinase [Firmicutes bacterium]|jgi:adenylate kinase|nr:adenylate kinase [Bacillota bacterium]